VPGVSSGALADSLDRGGSQGAPHRSLASSLSPDFNVVRLRAS